MRPLSEYKKHAIIELMTSIDQVKKNSETMCGI